MVNEIQQWLEQARSKGLSDEQITEQLKGQGYRDDEIERLLNHQQPAQRAEEGSKMAPFLNVFIGLLGLVIAYFTFWFLLDETSIIGIAFISAGLTLGFIGFRNLFRKTSNLKTRDVSRNVGIRIIAKISLVVVLMFFGHSVFITLLKDGEDFDALVGVVFLIIIYIVSIGLIVSSVRQIRNKSKTPPNK